MNRISVRVGLAAVPMVATVAAWGGLMPAATAAQTPASAATSAAPVTPYQAGADAPTAELDGLRAARRTAGKIPAVRGHASVVAAANAAARRARAGAAARASRALVRPVAQGSARVLGEQLAAARGWTGAQFVCLDDLWTRESNWGVTASSPTSGAYGIPQAQPGSKMSWAGSGWRTDPATQIDWGLWYIATGYGSPCAAWAFWQAHSWY